MSDDRCIAAGLQRGRTKSFTVLKQSETDRQTQTDTKADDGPNLCVSSSVIIQTVKVQ